MRILIVEDEKKLADIIASRLRKEKYVVDISCDGEEGLDNSLTNIYDLILLDVMLPKINGFEILNETKINSIKLGQEATIEITSYEDKKLQGYITKISSTASNGRFSITVEFENDGEILLGMTANVTI